jgi:hypothetical protein
VKRNEEEHGDAGGKEDLKIAQQPQRRITETKVDILTLAGLVFIIFFLTMMYSDSKKRLIYTPRIA